MSSMSLGLGGEGPGYLTGSLFQAGSMSGAQILILFGLEKEEHEYVSNKASSTSSFEPHIPRFLFETKGIQGVPCQPPRQSPTEASRALQTVSSR